MKLLLLIGAICWEGILNVHGPTQAIGAWTTFLPTSIDQRMIMLDNINNTKTMYHSYKLPFLILRCNLDLIHRSG